VIRVLKIYLASESQTSAVKTSESIENELWDELGVPEYECSTDLCGEYKCKIIQNSVVNKYALESQIATALSVV
jgi:hypothetical protein